MGVGMNVLVMLNLSSLQSYIATQIMVDSKMLRGHRQDGKWMRRACLLLTQYLFDETDRKFGNWNFFFVTDVDFLAFMASRAFELAYSVIVLLCSRCVSHFYSVFYLQSFISFFEQLSQFFYRGKHLQACAPQKKVGLLLRPDTSSTIKANCCPQIFA